MKTTTVYRRRYKCPECKHKGRTSREDRAEQGVRCGCCGTLLLLEEQNETGTGYRESNLPAREAVKKHRGKEYEIGTSFERAEKKYQTVRDKDLQGCIMCDLFNVGDQCTTVICEGNKRSDGVDVYFAEVQK